MSRFNVAYKRIFDPTLPEPVRFLALLWAIGTYSYLTGSSFQEMYLRLGATLGFDWKRKPNALMMMAAAGILGEERRRFLEKLNGFAARRWHEKAEGRRQPRKGEREALYSEPWLLTSGEAAEKEGVGKKIMRSFDRA